MKDLKQMTPEELNNLAKELYQMKEHSEVLTSALSTLRARLLCKADGMVEVGEPFTPAGACPPLLLPTQRKELVTRFPELYGKHPNVLDVDELRNEVLKLQARFSVRRKEKMRSPLKCLLLGSIASFLIVGYFSIVVFLAAKGHILLTLVLAFIPMTFVISASIWNHKK